jgi:response regulator RpfG family c-di-GMP phosphodiesterase
MLVPTGVARTLSTVWSPDATFYLPNNLDGEPLLNRHTEYGLAQSNFEALNDGGVDALLVRAEDLGRAEMILEDKLCEVLGDPRLLPDQKASCVQHVGASVAGALLDAPTASANTERASNVLDVVIDSLLTDRCVAESLLKITDHHSTTASHMFSVSVLAMMLAAEAFGYDEALLREIGLAGLLHDLGKTLIPQEVLNKAGQLDHAELQMIRQHPVDAVRIIGDSPSVSTMVRQMILQHHERMDGSGYPIGLPGSKLLPGSKILAIVDTFHALIGRRTYRSALQPTDAHRIIGHHVGKHFDAELYASWNVVFRRSWQAGHTLWMACNRTPVDPMSCRNEHRRLRLPKRMDARRPRFRCHEKTGVHCVYTQRLVGATQAPDQFRAPLYDLSSSGLCMWTRDPMYRGEVVHVLLNAGNNTVWARGVVAWCAWQPGESRYRTGVQLVQRLAG